MRFPIDTSSLRFIVAAAPEPVRRHERGRAPQARSAGAGENGAPLWRVPLIALGDGPSDVMRVAVAGDPQLEPGATVAVKDLTAQTWKRDGRRGVSLRASAIITEDGPGAPAGA